MFPLQTTVPWRHPPVATLVLIAVNSGVFLYELALGPHALSDFLTRFALIPARDLGAGHGGLDAWLPFLANTFLHGGWLHLIVNMWTLWLFGPPIEDRLGHGCYLLFYLGCGVLAAVSHAVFNAGSTVPALGASGAIAGVLGCYIRLFPLSRVIVLVPILFLPLFFALPALLFVGFWFLMQVLQGAAELLTPSTGAGIAWWAHVGGFVAGLALTPVLRKPERRHRRYYRDEGVLGFTPHGRR